MGHCGPTARGEFARTLNLTDVLCGWMANRSRAEHRNDRATIESKKNNLVRRNTYYWGDDTPEGWTCRTGSGRCSTIGSTTSPRPASPSNGQPTRTDGASASTTIPPPHCCVCWPPARSHPASRSDCPPDRTVSNPSRSNGSPHPSSQLTLRGHS